MKKLLGILVLGLFLSGSGYAGLLTPEQYTKKNLEACTKNGKWICPKSKVLDLIEQYKEAGGFMEDCTEVNYRAPCTCEWAEGTVKKKYCEFKMKPTKINKFFQ